jgi:hypothetical protein
MAVRTMTSVESVSLRSRWRCLVSALTNVLAFLSEELLDLVTTFAVWDLNIVLGGAIVRHEGKEIIISDIKLIFVSSPVISWKIWKSNLRAGIPGDERWGHPCCGWMGKVLQASCQ